MVLYGSLAYLGIVSAGYCAVDLKGMITRTFNLIYGAIMAGGFIALAYGIVNFLMHKSNPAELEKDRAFIIGGIVAIAIVNIINLLVGGSVADLITSQMGL